MKLKALLSLFAWLALGLSAVFAQSVALDRRDAEIDAVDGRLADLRAEIESESFDDAHELEEELRAIMRGSRERLAPVSRRLSEVEHSLTQLGPRPGEGEPPEVATIAERRTALQIEARALEGQRTRILANIDEAGLLLGVLSAKRLALLYARLADYERTLFSPALWREAAAGAGGLSSKVGRYFSDWSGRQTGDGWLASWGILGAAIVGVFILLGPAHRWIANTLPATLTAREPTPQRRAAVAAGRLAARALPGFAGGLLLIAATRLTGLLGEDGLQPAYAFWFGLTAYLVVDGFARSLFTPASADWRHASVAENGGRSIAFWLRLMIAVYGAKLFAVAIFRVADTSAALTTFVEALAAAVAGVCLFMICRRALWRGAAEAREGPVEASQVPDRFSGRGVALRRLGRVLGALVLFAALAGFVRFADFAASRIYFLALIFIVAWAIRAALKEALCALEARVSAKRHAGDQGDDPEFIRFWIGAGVDFIVVLALTPAALALAGIDWLTVRDIVWRAFLGFRIGGVSISLSDILVALGVFFGILAITRFLQGALQRGPFAHSRLDPGVQNSLTTLFGYVGLVVALVAGVTALGFNLASLAIIAGALSLGIGFGLQSIVNNFVSGIILLFERPIKVGDWVVTTSGEGTVRKISVRSTEIETFDRASIIVPNSELISQTVTNWTHKNKIGRISVKVGVSYNSDPELVREILLKCAREHPLIVRYPEPFVVWSDFGSSSLDFEVRAFLRDISTGLAVRTDLRYAIFKAFKEAGVEIPYPQRDVYIKTPPEATAPGGGVAPDAEAAIESEELAKDD